MMKNKLMRFLRNPRVRYGSVSTAMLCIFLAALVALNMLTLSLEKKNGWRVDYSFNALTTQSEATLDILAKLPHPVHIYALFSKGQEDLPLMELLDRYAAASPLVTWEQTDVSLHPGLMTKFRGSTSDQTVTNDSLIVYCEATDRFRILSPADFISLSLDYEAGVYEIAGLTYESEITSAIAYVTREDIPRVVIAQDHGELDESMTASLKELLTANHFEVVYASLMDAETVLAPGDLLMLLSPLRDLTAVELKKITDFTAQGGSLLITCDYSDPVEDMPNYLSLLRAYGFLPRTGIVVASGEEPNTYYDNVQINLIPTMHATDMTLELVQSGADTLLLTGSRAFEMPQESDQHLTTLTLLSSGYKAYLRDLSGGNMAIEQSDEDAVGPFALGLQATRVTEAGHVSKAVILGCSTLLTSSQVHAMTDAQEFIVTAVQYLSGAQSIDLDIMAKTAVRPQLSVNSTRMGSMLLICLPLAVLFAALAVLLPRRHK